MSDGQTPYFKGAIWLGLLVLIPVTALLFSALRAESEAPKWIVIAAVLKTNFGIGDESND